MCSEFVIPIINITKRRHIKEYNIYIYIKNTIDAFKDNKYVFIICSYLMHICCERSFKLSQDEYLELKKIIDNNIDIIESAFAPMVDYFDLYRKCYNHYYCSCNSHYYKKKVKYIFSSDEYNEFHKKIMKSYFNIWYIKFFYLLQKDIKLNKNIRIYKSL